MSGKSLGQKQRCMYPGCRVTAKTTWALVPLCVDHRENIRIETVRFYKSGNASRDYIKMRPHYMRIAHLTPWGYAGPKPEYERDYTRQTDQQEDDADDSVCGN